MRKTGSHLNRRQVVKGVAATGLMASAIARPAFAAPTTIKIGLVQPKTGPLALFSQEMDWAVAKAKKFTGNSITISGTKHPLEFVVKDSQSNPNRASEVTQELILKDKVHIVATFATPETVNPVSDQCELNGVPASPTTIRWSLISSAARATRRRASIGPTTSSSAPVR